MAETARGRAYIGTSGFHYAHWRGVFYPPGLPASEWFAFYARRFDTVEINNSFYRLPDARTFENWRDAAPEVFTYALKFSRFGSHLKRLLDPAATIGLFMGRAEILGAHLGPILVQLPPRWKPEVERLDAFLAAVPENRRWAIEVRDARWLSDAVYDVLRRHRAALCIHDMIANHPRVLTADWTYLRFHGAAPDANYPDEILAAAAGWIDGQLAAGRDVYAYFNNDVGGHAIRNAETLRRFVGRGS